MRPRGAGRPRPPTGLIIDDDGVRPAEVPGLTITGISLGPFRRVPTGCPGTVTAPVTKPTAKMLPPLAIKRWIVSVPLNVPSRRRADYRDNQAGRRALARSAVLAL